MRTHRFSFIVFIIICALALGGGFALRNGGPNEATETAAERSDAGGSLARAAASPRKTLTVGLVADPESMDPYFVYHPSGFAVMEALFDSLVIVDDEGHIVPHLASAWDVKDDTTIELTLRDDVTFHNGERFDAHAVAFSIRRVLDPRLQSGLKADYDVIETVDIVDDFRVRLHLARPDSGLLWRLTELAMLPPAYVQRVGDIGFARKPVGTGPFRFVERVRDDRVVVAANVAYPDDTAKGRPLVDEVVFRTLPEETTRVAELRTGGIDIGERIPADMVPTLTAAGIGVVAADTGRFFVAWFAPRPDSPLQDPRVRRALNYAVDAQTIANYMFGGFAAPIASPFTPSTLGFDTAVNPFPFDADKARALLAEAGYADGFDLIIDTTAGRANEAQAVAGMLRDVGVRATVRPLETSIFNTNWTLKQTGDLVAASWAGAGDPQQYLNMLVRSDGALSRYANAEADALLRQSETTVDPDERTTLLHRLQRVLHDDPAAIYLWSAADIYGVNPRVKNWQPPATERMFITNLFTDPE